INPQDLTALQQVNLFTHQQLEAVQKAKTELQTKLNQIQTELDQAQIDKGRLLQGMNSLYQEHQKKLNKINKLQQQIQQREQGKTQQEQTIADLTTESNTVQRANQQQETIITDLRTELDQTKQQNELLQQGTEKLYNE